MAGPERVVDDPCCTIFEGRKFCPLCDKVMPVPWDTLYGFHWELAEDIASDPEDEWYADAILALLDAQLKGTPRRRRFR